MLVKADIRTCTLYVVRRKPTEVLKNSPSALFSSTAIVEFAYSDLIIVILLFCIPNLYNADHNPSWYTRSNAFLKSMKLRNRFFGCLDVFQ